MFQENIIVKRGNISANSLLQKTTRDLSNMSYIFTVSEI
jgi:hypothetical protein